MDYYFTQCEGLPDGPCPKNIRDQSVKLGTGDLMLCPDCDNTRHQQFLAAKSLTVSAAIAPTVPVSTTRFSSRVAAARVNSVRRVSVNSVPPAVYNKPLLLPTDTVQSCTQHNSIAAAAAIDQSAQHRTASTPASNPPACRIPSTSSSMNAVISAGQTGSCSVCRRNGIHVVNKTGLLRNHGPHGNKCKGSRSRPFPGSQQSAQPRQDSADQSQTSAADTLTAASVNVTSSTQTQSAASQSDVLQHPPRNIHILKRIPKGARLAAANLLQKLIHDVLQHPTSTASWSRLLGFSGACLVKPTRGGKSRNLTTTIVKQVRQYELGTEPADPVPPSNRSSQRNKPAKTFDETVARMASAKLEDGDIKGAVRLLCSDDRLAIPDVLTFVELERLHPPAPTDRRPAPTSVTSPLQVSTSAVRAAIQSFPNGSAAGPDGLRPQHIKDLLVGAADDNPLLVAVTDLTNLLLEGKAPPSVRGTIFGANLLAIAKKTGGIRPIAVGYVWRRLTAKVACSHVKDASAALLAPRQLGFGVSGGAEAAVRAARRYLENMERGKLFVKIDFRNAFNMLRRDSILEAVAKHFPELLPFASSTISSPSDLQFAEFILQSEEGAQQGDPLGPLYFCLVFKELLESLQSELVVGYLDDAAMGGEAETVLKDFLHIESAAKLIGLEMNRNKCEVVGHTDDTRTLFTAHGIILPETSRSTVILLGAPLSAGQHLDSVLEGKREELQRLTRRLEFMPSHDSLYLLRNVLTAPRLMYLLRTAPCSDSQQLPQYDAAIRESLSTTLNVDMDDETWAQASLPVRWGGLGVRSVTLLAPSAYLASAANTAELTAALLPARLRDIEDSGVAVAMAAWKRLATAAPISTTTTPISREQRAFDDPCCQVQADRLLDSATDHVERARLLASRSAGSGDWLNALPISSVGLKMDNETVRIAVGLRLGAPIVRSHICVCGTTVTVDGHHGLSCRHGSGRHARHNFINELICRAFISTGTLATREPHGLCTSDGKRPDGVTQVPWKRGRCLAWDATCPDTFAMSHVSASSTEAGSAAASAEINKTQKYRDIIAGVDFVPVAIETSGVWGSEGLDLIKDIGRRITTVSHDPRSTTFLRQRISMAVQRGNAFCVLGTFTAARSDNESVQLS